MNAIADRRSDSALKDLPKIFDPSRTIHHIRQLIFLYLLLLIFEGAFRKWIVPQLSAPLLLIRDPVVILIYLLAFRAKIFPHNIWVITLEIIAVLSWATGIIVLLPYFPISTIILVTGYGVRSDFLHLPLIFIIPLVFDLEDVKRIGRWTIIGMIPMAALMVAQFAASPDSFINRAAGLGEGTQIAAGGGKIRPPAVFSFVSGAVYYSSAAAAFILHSVLARLPYRTWLLYASGTGLIVSLGVSGSRSAVLAVVVVVASLGVDPARAAHFGEQVWAPSAARGGGALVGQLSADLPGRDRGSLQSLHGIGRRSLDRRRPGRTNLWRLYRGADGPRPGSVRRLRARRRHQRRREFSHRPGFLPPRGK